MVKIENWHMQGDPFAAPEISNFRLHGNVYDHPKHEDGTEVTTTRILNLVLTDKKVQTRNTIYILGKPEPEYLKFLKEYKSTWYELFKEYENEA